MANTPTTTYALNKPDSGDTGWGVTMNANLDSIDTNLKAVSDVADAAMPLAGGSMTGRANLYTSTAVLLNKGSISGSHNLDLSVANVFTATIIGATDFTFANPPSGTFLTGFILYLSNGGTNVSWPAAVNWPAGIAPTLQAAGLDILVFTTVNDGTVWHGVLASGNSS